MNKRLDVPDKFILAPSLAESPVGFNVHTAADVHAMLDVIGLHSVEQLFEDPATKSPSWWLDLQIMWWTLRQLGGKQAN